MEEYISDNSFYVGNKSNSMINPKMIGRVLGILLFIELGMFLLCAGISVVYGESDYKYFLYTCIINAIVGGLLLLYGKGAKNKQTVSPSIVTTVLLFFAFYLIITLIGWTMLLFLGVGFAESISTVISSIGNVGPGLGACGSAYLWNSLPDAAKWILSFLMLIGRLELFSVLLLFYPGFWKNR